MFGVNSFIGKKLVKFAQAYGMNTGLIDLSQYANSNLEQSDAINYQKIISGQEDSVNQAVEQLIEDLGKVDYLICNYYLEELRDNLNNKELSAETWDKYLKNWALNYFLILRAVVPKMIKVHQGKVIFFNSARGYTGEGEGEGEPASGGSLYEAGCSSGITGMMTSLARDIIPEGISVHGIALGNDYRQKWPQIEWALNLWLSGLGDYACGQIIRVY